MDNAYKTNKYKLFVLEIINVTFIGFTFLCGFTLLASTQEKKIILALEELRRLFLRVNVFPRVSFN